MHLPGTVEEMALPLKGKKRKLDGAILIDYFGCQRLALNRRIVAAVMEQINRHAGKGCHR